MMLMSMECNQFVAKISQKNNIMLYLNTIIIMIIFFAIITAY
jgi:hypothetical protein